MSSTGSIDISPRKASPVKSQEPARSLLASCVINLLVVIQYPHQVFFLAELLTWLTMPLIVTSIGVVVSSDIPSASCALRPFAVATLLKCLFSACSAQNPVICLVLTQGAVQMQSNQVDRYGCDGQASSWQPWMHRTSQSEEQSHLATKWIHRWS